jgi:hypothetical protein
LGKSSVRIGSKLSLDKRLVSSDLGTISSCSSSVERIEFGVDQRSASSRLKYQDLIGSWKLGGLVPSGGPYEIQSTLFRRISRPGNDVAKGLLIVGTKYL